MTMPSEDRSVTTLLGDLAQHASALIQTEVRLLRVEMSEKISQMGTGGAEVLAGALCLFAALLILLQALVVALANLGLGAGWASLLVGIVVAALGAFLLRNGSAQLSPSNLTPTRTQEQVARDMRVAKEQLK
jgi:Putative Actinobacterial Holin-X, holin superfamily III